MKGQVVSLHLGLGSGLPKPRVEALELVAGFGAKGDRHAGKDPDRAVLVAGLSAYEKAQGAGIPLPYGALGENLLLDLDPHALPPGARLRVGRPSWSFPRCAPSARASPSLTSACPSSSTGAGGVRPGPRRRGGAGGDPVLVLAPAR